VRVADLRPSSFVSLSHLPPLSLSISETVLPEYDEVRVFVGATWKDQNRLVTDKCPIYVLQRYPGSIGATRTREVILISTRGPHQRALFKLSVTVAGYGAISSEAC
jgi:hypothetical protein